MPYYDIAPIIRKIKKETVTVALPHLVEMLPTERGNSILGTIASIQKRCRFYNYAIATQSPPPPAVSQESGVGNQGQTINNFNIDTLNANHSALNLGGTVQGDQTINQHHKPES